MPRFTLFLLSLVLSTLLPACRFGGSGPEARGYTLVYLKTGARSALTKEESQTVFAGHFANMERLAREHKLLLAGPFGETRHDPGLRGVYLLDTADAAEARDWAESDPGVQAGVFTLEFHALETRAALRALLTEELARMQAEEAAGQKSAPGAFGRKYVLLTAADGPQLERELAGEPFALLHGRLDGAQGWAVLDAESPEAALELLGASSERMGTFVLDGWFATRALAGLPALSDG